MVNTSDNFMKFHGVFVRGQGANYLDISVISHVLLATLLVLNDFHSRQLSPPTVSRAAQYQ